MRANGEPFPLFSAISNGMFRYAVELASREDSNPIDGQSSPRSVQWPSMYSNSFWVIGVYYAVVADEDDVDDFGDILSPQGLVETLNKNPTIFVDQLQPDHLAYGHGSRSAGGYPFDAPRRRTRYLPFSRPFPRRSALRGWSREVVSFSTDWRYLGGSCCRAAGMRSQLPGRVDLSVSQRSESLQFRGGEVLGAQSSSRGNQHHADNQTLDRCGSSASRTGQARARGRD